MQGNWRERFARWWCSKFGHRTYIDYCSAGGCDPEICYRCNALVSTAYSRMARIIANDPVLNRRTAPEGEV